jgi:predicted nucleic acid-binding protein
VTAFADTSGRYALLVSTEESHAEVASAFARILEHSRPLLTTNYVLVETAALLQRRIGMGAVRDLEERIMPCCTVRWITEALHRRAWERFIRADRRGLSLVDCTSFELMQQEGIDDVLALDLDFADAGFRLLPALA